MVRRSCLVPYGVANGCRRLMRAPVLAGTNPRLDLWFEAFRYSEVLMLVYRFSILVSALLTLFTCLLKAQNLVAVPAVANSTGALLPEVTITTRVDEVNLAFTVTDKRGRFISDLQKGDFDVLDNRLPPQALRYFQQQSDLPMNVALLIDASDSTRYRFRFEQRAAVSFLKNIIRPGKDQAMVLAFNTQVHLIHDLTDNVKLLAKDINKVKPGGDTALYDAIGLACNRLRNSPPGTRRAIILLSDGIDTASRRLLYDAQEASARAEVTMFALSTNDLTIEEYPKGEAVMDLLTQPTGGRILPAREESQLTSAFRQLEKTLRSQYALAYQPAEFLPDGKFRKIEVIPHKHGLKVQCRRGYYARQEQAQNLQSSSK
jgi:Ca-activated chloride channel family protein